MDKSVYSTFVFVVLFFSLFILVNAEKDNIDSTEVIVSVDASSINGQENKAKKPIIKEQDFNRYFREWNEKGEYTSSEKISRLSNGEGMYPGNFRFTLEKIREKRVSSTSSYLLLDEAVRKAVKAGREEQQNMTEWLKNSDFDALRNHNPQLWEFAIRALNSGDLSIIGE